MKRNVNSFKFIKITCILLLSLFSTVTISAKDNKGFIMTVDGENISSEEFIYLFQKNNTQLTQPQSLDEYLKLFEIYRLKVAEAKKEGIDTTASFKKEINQYKRELLEPYITDTLFINSLVAEAAERDKVEVESSHIMIIRTHDEEKDKRNLEILDSLRNELLNGADFIELAKKYSQDRFSSERGGYLGFTPAGTFPYGFETAEYETPEGEISDIVESHVGWHIVKSGARKPVDENLHPARTYGEIKADVLRKASSPFDSRYKDIRHHNLLLLKNKHPKLGESLDSVPEDEAYEVLIAAEEKWQYDNNKDYKNLIDEYTNGSLLYEVSVKNVWDKASQDEEGLNNFYHNNREKYSWDTPHAKGVLIQSVNDSVSNLIKGEIKGMSQEDIINHVRTNFKKQATADKFNLTKGQNPMIDHIMFGGEDTKPKNRNFTDYFIVEGRIVDSPEELNDVRGNVITDYQEVLEQEWVDYLKENHKVETNLKEFSRIRKSMN